MWRTLRSQAIWLRNLRLQISQTTKMGVEGDGVEDGSERAIADVCLVMSGEEREKGSERRVGQKICGVVRRRLTSRVRAFRFPW